MASYELQKAVAEHPELLEWIVNHVFKTTYEAKPFAGVRRLRYYTNGEEDLLAADEAADATPYIRSGVTLDQGNN
jgi:hypothetical protein